MKLFSSVIICLGTLKEVWSFRDGAGVTSCVSRYPNHGFPPQMTECPYTLTISKRHVYRNEKLQVTINGTKPFRGFMIQARHESDPSPLGKFYNSVNGVNMHCGSYLENTISHYESGLKNATVVEWEAARVRSDFVEFYATVVYDVETFWLDLKTPKLYIIENTSLGRMINKYKRRNDTYKRVTYRPYRFMYSFPQNRSFNSPFRRIYF